MPTGIRRMESRSCLRKDDAMKMTRREFVAVSAAAVPALAAGKAAITVGITVDTRPDWNGAENFIRSID